MIAGDSSVFAIECEIKTAYESHGLRGLGFFVIYVLGKQYGVRSEDSTMLACSYDAVKRRLANRGTHTAPFSSHADAGTIADAVRCALYTPGHDGDVFFGATRGQFADRVYSADLVWAPDGDAAFDDSSYVLQFDMDDKVRIIAFRSTRGWMHDPGTISDLLMCADAFYSTLKEWTAAFEKEWATMPKENFGSNVGQSTDVDLG